MVFINEWPPNPAGAGAKGEFVEHFNNGKTLVNLSGRKLATKNGKQFSLSGYHITAGGYLVLPRAVTKLTLRTAKGHYRFSVGKDSWLTNRVFRAQRPVGKVSTASITERMNPSISLSGTRCRARQTMRHCKSISRTLVIRSIFQLTKHQQVAFNSCCFLSAWLHSWRGLSCIP